MKRQDSAARATALRVALLTVIFSSLALLVALAAPTKGRAPENNAGRSKSGVSSPIIGHYPDTMIGLSGNTTVMPDSAPVSIASMDVSASTDFKGTLEGDAMTGVVRVTDAHPAGTYTVIVKAFDSGGGSSSTTFTLTVTTPITCNPVNFAAAASFAAGSISESVAVGDFNGDGNQDLVTANYASNDVSVLLGDGMGGFGAATSFAAGTGAGSVAVGDFNGDGKQDLAVADNFPEGKVAILLGDGMGGFSAATNFSAGNNPESVAVGDFNGDGKQDLAVASFGSNDVSVLLGNGMGGFGAATTFRAGFQARSVAV